MHAETVFHVFFVFVQIQAALVDDSVAATQWLRFSDEVQQTTFLLVVDECPCLYCV